MLGCNPNCGSHCLRQACNTFLVALKASSAAQGVGLQSGQQPGLLRLQRQLIPPSERTSQAQQLDCTLPIAHCQDRRVLQSHLVSDALPGSCLAELRLAAALCTRLGGGGL